MATSFLIARAAIPTRSKRAEDPPLYVIRMYICSTNMQAQTTSMELVGIWHYTHAVNTERNVHSFRSALKPLGKKLDLRLLHTTSPPLLLSSASWEAAPLCRGPRRKNTLQSSTYTGRVDPKELMCEFFPPRRITSPRGQFNVLSRRSPLYSQWLTTE